MTLNIECLMDDKDVRGAMNRWLASRLRSRIFRLRFCSCSETFWIRTRLRNFFPICKYDSCSNSANHQCRRNSAMFAIKEWHLWRPRRLLLPKVKVDPDFFHKFLTLGPKKTQNLAGIDSESVATSALFKSSLSVEGTGAEADPVASHAGVFRGSPPAYIFVKKKKNSLENFKLSSVAKFCTRRYEKASRQLV